MLRKQICDNVRKVNFYMLLADESKDENKKEQLAIIVRYVDEEAIIHERFLTFVKVTTLTAESLTTYLISTLNNHGLNPACILSEAYDGAAVMSGNCHGVQQRINEVYPCAIYVYTLLCKKLNLVLVDSAKKIQRDCDIFLLLEAINVFILPLKKILSSWQSKRNFIQKSKIDSYQNFQIQDGLADKLLLVQFATLTIL